MYIVEYGVNRFQPGTILASREDKQGVLPVMFADRKDVSGTAAIDEDAV